MIKRGWLESGWDGRQHRRLSPRFSLGTLFLGGRLLCPVCCGSYGITAGKLRAHRPSTNGKAAQSPLQHRPIFRRHWHRPAQSSQTRLDTGTRVDRGVTRQTPDMPFEKASQPDSAHQLRPLSLVLPNSLSGQALILEECAHRVWAFNNTQQAMERMRTAPDRFARRQRSTRSNRRFHCYQHPSSGKPDMVRPARRAHSGPKPILGPTAACGRRPVRRPSGPTQGRDLAVALAKTVAQRRVARAEPCPAGAASA